MERTLAWSLSADHSNGFRGKQRRERQRDTECALAYPGRQHSVDPGHEGGHQLRAYCQKGRAKRGQNLCHDEGDGQSVGKFGHGLFSPLLWRRWTETDESRTASCAYGAWAWIRRHRVD